MYDRFNIIDIGNNKKKKLVMMNCC